MGWIDPFSVAVIVLTGGLAFAVGVLRRQRRSIIALNTIGTAVFFAGIRWAIYVGDEAFGPMAAASLGAILFTMAAERDGAARR